MASSGPPPDPIHDTLCPICIDHLKNPVTVNCGHNFCKDCLNQHFMKCGEVMREMLCPICQAKITKENIRPNWQLKSLVENLILQSQSAGKGDLCVKHKEKFHLFCKEDKELMCLVCEKLTKHKGHSILPQEEAASTYKDQIMNCQKTLIEKRVKMLSIKTKTEKESQGLLEQVEVEREKTIRTFRELQQVLEEEERLLVSRMERIMKEIKREKENHLDKLEKERQSLEKIIQETEVKLHQSTLDLLQDIESFMNTCEVQKICEISPVTFPADLKLKIWDFCDVNCFLEAVLNSFKDSLVSGIQLKKADIHLDPETANPQLIVSEDCKSVRWRKEPQDVPDNPGRFNENRHVLGREEFSAGRHFWEVIVESGKYWSVGVARKTVKRKGYVKKCAEEGIWCIGKLKDEYWCSNLNDALLLNEEPRKIRVTLNCEGGRLAFYDADTGTLICEFPRGSITIDNLHPFFYILGHIQL